MVEKNQDYEVRIQDLGVNGEGIAKIEGYTTFVKDALTGEKVKIKMVKVNQNFGYGKLLQLVETSPQREEPICPSFGKCGGCNLQHLNYEAQLAHKLQMVKNTLRKQLGYEPLIEEIIGMGIPYYYRNKVQYPVCDGKIGFYSDRSHHLVENEICYIQNRKADQLAKDVFRILKENGVTSYDEKTGKGLLRHIITRIGIHTGELMLILVTNGERWNQKEKVIQEVVKAFPHITSIIQNVNEINTNVILGEKCICLYGREYIVDTLEQYRFKISPLSFYQVNPQQTEVLYGIAQDFAELQGTETVFDLYCGIGTISIFMADSCKKVYGVEVVPQAIANAKENAEMNEVRNAHFMVGEVEKVLPQLYQEGIQPDVIFVDPPRKGCDRKTIETMIQLHPKKLIYISCNPATLARDLALLTEKGFEVERMKLVDMFPQTNHVETIALLGRKSQ